MSDKAYEDIIEVIEKQHMEIPVSLDRRVEETMANLPYKRKSIYRITGNIAASITLFIIVSVIMIYSNETVAGFAENIPGFNIIAEWIHHDRGVNNAVDHHYPSIDTIIAESDGYQLILTNIMIDEERMVFNALVTGPGFDEANEGPIEVQVGEKSSYEYYGFHMNVPEHGSGISSSPIDIEGPGQARNIEIYFHPFEESYISQLVNEGGDLKLKCFVEVSNQDNVVDRELAEIDVVIPINDDNVLMAKRYPVNQTIELPQGDIVIKELLVSPTKMRIIAESIPAEGFDFIKLHEYKLIGKRGKEIYSEGVISFGGGNGENSYEFVPSIYFDDIDRLEFEVISYFYGNEKTYELSLNEALPKTLDYYGYDIEVIRLEYSGEDLDLDIIVKEYEDFDFQSLGLLDETYLESGRGVSYYEISEAEDGEANRFFTYHNVKGQETYEFEIDFPKRIVQHSQALVINIEKVE